MSHPINNITKSTTSATTHRLQTRKLSDIITPQQNGIAHELQNTTQEKEIVKIMAGPAKESGLEVDFLSLTNQSKHFRILKLILTVILDSDDIFVRRNQTINSLQHRLPKVEWLPLCRHWWTTVAGCRPDRVPNSRALYSLHWPLPPDVLHWPPPSVRCCWEPGWRPKLWG